VQLVEADTGHHVWAERYDRELDDIFDVQDEITKKVATELNVRLARGEEARVWSRGTTNIEAWEKIIRAFPLTDDHVKEHNAEAQRLATEAVQLDPTFITAVVVLGWTHLEDALWGWGESHRSSMRTALSFAERALQLDADNPEALALRGTIALFDKDVEKAIALCKRAVILSPSHAGNVALAAMAMIFGGNPENGLPLMKRAIRLSPIYPQWYLLLVGAVHHINGAQQKAIEIFRECLANEPETTLHRLWLASALIATGQDEEAKLLAAEIVEIDPDFKTSSWLEAFSRDDALTDLLLTNLGKAGLPN
jgi:adenylate cyclase